MIETIRKQINSGELAVSVEKGNPDLLGDVITTAFFDMQKKTVTFFGKQSYVDINNATIATRQVREAYDLGSPKYLTLSRVAGSIETLLRASEGGKSQRDTPRTRPYAGEVIQKLQASSRASAANPAGTVSAGRGTPSGAAEGGATGTIQGSTSGRPEGSSVGLYGDKVREAVQREWRQVNDQGMPGLKAVLEVQIKKNGELVGIQVVKPSGNAIFDDAAKRAVLKAAPLPAVPEVIVQPSTKLILTFLSGRISKPESQEVSPQPESQEVSRSQEPPGPANAQQSKRLVQSSVHAPKAGSPFGDTYVQLEQMRDYVKKNALNGADFHCVMNGVLPWCDIHLPESFNSLLIPTERGLHRAQGFAVSMAADLARSAKGEFFLAVWDKGNSPILNCHYSYFGDSLECQDIQTLQWYGVRF